MKRKKMILIVMIIIVMLVPVFFASISVVTTRETLGIRTVYDANAYYTTQDEIKILLKGTDENIKTNTLNANSVTVKVAGTAVTPTKKTVTSSSTSSSEVVMLLTLSGFTTEGQISLDIAANTLEDNNGNKNLAKTITTTSYVRFPTYGLEGSGADIILTRANYAQYLGRKITNYKTVGGTETVTTTTKNYSNANQFTVSTTYRLYYIDWDNKYGDGAGTIYLKADCTNNNYTLANGFTYNANTSKIAKYNPSLYASGVTTPATTNNNMKSVSWLLDTNEWNGLKISGNSTGIGGAVKHVVGAPPLEMMMDSFNAHYGGTKTTLLYNFVSGGYGYQVGPNTSLTSADFGTYTADYSVPTDSAIDNMYYPGMTQCYWLASPSAKGVHYLINVFYSNKGFMSCSGYNSELAFCPLVALNSAVQLKFAN